MNVPSHPVPMLSVMVYATTGNIAAMTERTIVFAEEALDAYKVYV